MPLFTRTPSRRARAIGTAVAGGAAVPFLLMAAAPAHALDIEYTVRAGDNPWAIAQRFGVPYADLLAMNGLTESSIIYPGQVLRVSDGDTPAVPAPTPSSTYTVRAGDNPWAIAQRLGVPYADLLAVNGLTDSSIIHPGQVLQVPGGTSPAVPAPTPSSTYTVRAGDNPWAIAQRLGVRYADLLAVNGLTESSIIHPGQVLQVPGGTTPAVPAPTPSSTYTVRAGDNPWAIAQRFDVSHAALLAANGLTASSLIHPGQVLVIPTDSTAPAPAPLPVEDTSTTSPYPRYDRYSPEENRRLLESVSVPSPARMQEMVRATALRMGVDPTLALAHAHTESRFDMRSVSNSNAIGVMQVIPVTGEYMAQLQGEDLNLLDPQDNVTAGVAYIKYVQDRTPTLDLGIGAYYQGLGGILRDGPRADTYTYIAKVRAAMSLF